MRQVFLDAPGEVRVAERDDPRIIDPTDAVIRLAATCICGSDLWPYRGVEDVDHSPMGHEYVGIVEEIGSQVSTVKPGDFVVGSFVISDGTCEICLAGYPSKCVNFQFVSADVGTQSERARIPHADGTLVATPGPPDPIWSRNCSRPPTCSAPDGSRQTPPTPGPQRPSRWSVTVLSV